jgi:hypothetical protein
MRAFVTLVLLLGVCGVASAVVGPEYFAVGIPDGLIPTIDGDLSDWAWVPDEYIITGDMMTDVINQSPVDLADWDCKIIVGWNASTQLLYIGAETVDDTRIRTFAAGEFQWYLDDCMEFAMDPDMDGAQYEWPGDNETGSQWFFCIPEYEAGCLNPSTWMVDNPNYFKTGWEMDGKVYRYELAVALWDFMAIDENGGEEGSTRTLLEEDKTIALAIAFDDVDVVGAEDESGNFVQARDAQWCTSPGETWYMVGADHSPFILMPVPPDITSAETTSWGMVKSLFK